MRRKGLFITFEGPEGCGKSTQIKGASRHLRRRGVPVLVLREPGGTRVGEAIRKIILDGSLREMTPHTELLLYLAARSQVVREKILPALRSGNVVICDRFEDSTLAYQGAGRGLGRQDIRRMSRFARGSLEPDLTILLDLDPKKGIRRKARRDRMERESLRFHQKVRRGFLALAKRNPKRFVIISGTLSESQVAHRIKGALAHVLSRTY